MLQRCGFADMCVRSYQGKERPSILTANFNDEINKIIPEFRRPRLLYVHVKREDADVPRRQIRGS